MPKHDRYLHNDVVDGNVDKLDEEADKAHDGKSNCSGHGNLLELYSWEKKQLVIDR